MPEHITRCPNCKTSFRIPEKLLHSAKGAVRCGSCLNIFVARNFLVASPAPQASTTSKAKAPNSASSKTAQAKKEATKQTKKDDVLISDDMDSIISDTAQMKIGTDDFSSEFSDEFTESLKLSGAKQDQNLFERELKTNDSDDTLTSDESWALNLLKNEENGTEDTGSDKDTIEPGRKKHTPPKKHKLALTKNEDDTKQPTPELKTENPGDIYQQRPSAPIEPNNDLSHEIEYPSEYEPKHQPEPEIEPEYAPEQENNYQNYSTEGDKVSDTEDSHSPLNVNTTEYQSEEYDDAPYAENQEEYDQLVASQQAYAAYEEPDNYLDAIEPEPVELEWKGKSSWLQSSYTWGGLALIFAMLLIVQFGWIKFDTYSRIEPYRNYYAIACEKLDCSLPQLIDRAKIKTSKFIVREHPRQTNALMADVILQNNAPFEQVFPPIELIFTDVKNNIVARRTFQPHEYLGGELSGRKTMPMRQPVHIAFELVDPGQSAVGYRINISK